jgi:UDP-N-acetylmuramoylalanine--D-glutamate ligase
VSARPPLPPGPYLVVGLARSGAGAALMLREHGEVIGLDSGVPAQAEVLGRSIELHTGSDGLDLLDRAGTVVKSPGVPQEAPVVAAARERGIEVTGELELAWRLLPQARFVAVTGTNGKTTTTELLGALAREAGIDVAVAGNVGTPLSSLVGQLREGAVVVCECSSFQLEDASRFAPEAALLLNLEEDHLDRHGTFEAYRAAKLRIFANQGPNDVAVVRDTLDVPTGDARRVAFGGAGSDLELRDGELLWHGEPLMGTSEIRLRGEHNLENAMGAAATAFASGWPAGAVRSTLATFAGVPHRLEEVADRDGVLYVNDSKATNVASARVGIEAFPGRVHAILGGSIKGGGFTGLRGSLESRGVAAYLIGDSAERLAADLHGAVPLHHCGDLASAVEAARAAAQPGDVILLSPATASYDQYPNYERRGEHFRELANG